MIMADTSSLRADSILRMYLLLTTGFLCLLAWRQLGNWPFFSVQQHGCQCDKNTGKGGLASMLLVAPPRMKSRIRECPNAPITSRSRSRAAA